MGLVVVTDPAFVHWRGARGRLTLAVGERVWPA